jgi:hypothetical protein
MESSTSCPCDTGGFITQQGVITMRKVLVTFGMITDFMTLITQLQNMDLTDRAVLKRLADGVLEGTADFAQYTIVVPVRVPVTALQNTINRTLQAGDIVTIVAEHIGTVEMGYLASLVALQTGQLPNCLLVQFSGRSDAYLCTECIIPVLV